MFCYLEHQAGINFVICKKKTTNPKTDFSEVMSAQILTTSGAVVSYLNVHIFTLASNYKKTIVMTKKQNKTAETGIKKEADRV